MEEQYKYTTVLHSQRKTNNLLQKTIDVPASLQGIGIHSGEQIQLTLKPARANTGIVFVRTDVKAHGKIKALWSNVVDTNFCTKIANRHGTIVGTIEHLMAALYACEIDNLIVELNGPEVPVMDGSAAPFVHLINKAGTCTQDAKRPFIKILRTVTIEEPGRWASISPSDSFAMDCDFHFDGLATMKPQHYSFDGSTEAFKNDIIAARTFGFLQNVEKLRSLGLAKGGSLDNAVIIDGDQVLNPEGFRYPDECVRHKILDAVGDLYLAGAPIKGYFQGSQIGHEMQNKLLRALFADKKAWELCHHKAPSSSSVRLPSATITAAATI